MAINTLQGYEDLDVYTERLAQQEEQREGRQALIATDDGRTLPFTRENVAEKLREGFKMVNVNYVNQKSPQLYSYLTKQNVNRGNTVYAPFTYSPLFNPALAGQTRLAQAIIQSIQTSFKNVMGQSSFLEQQGVNLKVIGGGGIKEAEDFVVGGGRIYKGSETKGGQRVNIASGMNATQTISE